VEDLTKHQLILIVLLITFVTSIATGIITFSLLSKAPVEITQTIDRVVERTIQQVAPTVDQPQKTVTTVVVTEEDRILDAISKNEKSIVRLKTVGSDGSEIVAGLGLVISPDGTIAFDLRSYNAASSYTILFFDGRLYSIGKVFIDNEDGLAFIKAAVPPNENPKYTFYPTVFGDSNGLKIGQTLVAISGKDSNAASIGRIFQLTFGDDKKTVKRILSDIKVSSSHFGSPVLNLSGEVVGIEAQFADVDTEYSYVPINIVKAATTRALSELAK
jgi:S1-C subfamily serine protease